MKEQHREIALWFSISFVTAFFSLVHALRGETFMAIWTGVGSLSSTYLLYGARYG